MRPFYLSASDMQEIEDQFRAACDAMEQPMTKWDAIECSYDRLGNQQVRAFGASMAGPDHCAIEVRFLKKPISESKQPQLWTWRAEAEVSDRSGVVRNILRLDSNTDEVTEYMRVIPKD